MCLNSLKFTFKLKFLRVLTLLLSEIVFINFPNVSFKREKKEGSHHFLSYRTMAN